MLVFRWKILGEIPDRRLGASAGVRSALCLELHAYWSFSRFPLIVSSKIISICSNGEFALALVDPVLYQADRNKLWLSDNENLSDEEEGLVCHGCGGKRAREEGGTEWHLHWLPAKSHLIKMSEKTAQDESRQHGLNVIP